MMTNALHLCCFVIGIGHLALLSTSVVRALQFARTHDTAVVPVNFPRLVAFYEAHVLVEDDPTMDTVRPGFFLLGSTAHNSSSSMKIASRPTPSGYGVQLYLKDSIEGAHVVDDAVTVCASWTGRSDSTPCLHVTLMVLPVGIDPCRSASAICFGHDDQQPTSLEILESRRIPQDVVTLHQPVYAEACPTQTPRYNYTQPSVETTSLLSVTDRGRLVLTARSNAADYSDVQKNFAFEVGCGVTTTDGVAHSLVERGTLRVTHANDHGPEPSEPSIIIINNTKDFTYKILSVRDHDRRPSPYTVELLDDRLHLFTLTVNKKRFIPSIDAWLISAILRPKSPGSIDLLVNSYTTRVRFVDTTLKVANFSTVGQVIYTIKFVKPGYTQPANPTVLSDLHGAEFKAIVHRNAAFGSRVLQPIDANTTFLAGVVFHLERSDASTPLPFNVTPSEGIIYVNDSDALGGADASDSIIFRLAWTATKPQSSDIALPLGHLSISARIVDASEMGPSPRSNSSCGGGSTRKDHDVMCSMSGSETTCDDSCGAAGAANGRCRWRNSTQYRYATCSPDLNTCPDKVCDELERTFYYICPQDCVETVQVHGTHFSSGQSHGISNGHGTCTCDLFGKCSCDVSKLDEDEEDESSLTDVDFADGRWTSKATSRSSGEDNASARSVPVGQDVDEQCGPVCVAMITGMGVVVVGALVVCYLAFGRRRACAVHWTRSKYPNRDNSVPAVPSDYVVDERVSSSSSASTAAAVAAQNIILQDILSIPNKNMQAIESRYEFPRNRLILEQTLGEGEFGRVMRAKAMDINGQFGYTTVAVKMSKSVGSSAEQDLLQEFNLLREVVHPNVIRVLGACSSCIEGPLFIIVEYAEFGSLRVYLRKSRRLDFHSCTSDDSGVDSLAAASNNHQPSDYLVNPRDLLAFAWQIAKGMAYLSEMKLVHRDLASRNILVAAGKVVKISDFGLTRDVYEGDAYFKKSTGRVPVKWMAIESLSDHVYTTKSDVWSFGIVLWEIITLGAAPYPGVPPETLYRLLKSGYRMEKPDNCSEELYQIMKRCWHEVPQERPSFVELTRKFDDMLQANVEYLELAVNMVHNMTYFEDTTGQTDTVGEESEMGYGSWNALPNDGSDYLAANCRSSNVDVDGDEDEEVAFLLTDKSGGCRRSDGRLADDDEDMEGSSVL